MNKLFLGMLLTISIVTISYAGVKRIYIGSYANDRAMYVIQCDNGNSYSEINKHKNEYWYSGGSNMGDDYKNLSIDGVAFKKCS